MATTTTKKSKKLALTRETLRDLTPGELSVVVGGVGRITRGC